MKTKMRTDTIRIGRSIWTVVFQRTRKGIKVTARSGEYYAVREYDRYAHLFNSPVTIAEWNKMAYETIEAASTSCLTYDASLDDFFSGKTEVCYRF